MGARPPRTAGRQRARAVSVERDVGDRLRAAVVAALDERAVVPLQVLDGGVERDARELLRLVADLAGRADDRARCAVGRDRVEAVPGPESVRVRGDDLDVERGDAELLGDDLRVVTLVA